MERPGEGHGHGIVGEPFFSLREFARSTLARFIAGGPKGLIELTTFVGTLLLVISHLYPPMLLSTMVLSLAGLLAAATWACVITWRSDEKSPPPPNLLKGA